MELDPTPSESLRKKFIYFYEPYNFESNFERYMTFEDKVNETKAMQLKNLLSEQAHLESPEANLDEFGQLIDHERKDLKKEIHEMLVSIADDRGRFGWREIKKFILDREKNTFDWTLEQIKIIHGKMPKKGKKRPKKMD